MVFGAISPLQAANSSSVWVLPIEGAIGPATSDLLVRTLVRADNEGVHLLVITLDTPGGLDLAMRDMIKAILNSNVPVVIYVSPNGARAASAGTYLTYASHVAAMAPATNIGSSTPVSIGGGSPFPAPAKPPSLPISPDGIPDPVVTDPVNEPNGAMKRKVINDAAAYIRGLAILRGRNADWAERSVRDGVNLTAEDALKENVVDLVTGSLPDLLAAIDGRTVIVANERPVILHTKNAATKLIEPDWRHQFLAIITNPNVAYLLLMVGLYGLIIEFYNPGMGVPGVVGVICLLVGAFALQMLPINYVGLALIIFGVSLMVAEAMAPSFGILGLGGIAAFALGSIMLFDAELPGFRISIALIAALAACSAAIFVLALGAAVRARARPVVTGKAEMIGSKAIALEGFDGSGRVHVRGEDWQAVADSHIEAGAELVVTAIHGLTLTVVPQE
jgi:membrane-bound serine protease (ClpP class)